MSKESELWITGIPEKALTAAKELVKLIERKVITYEITDGKGEYSHLRRQYDHKFAYERFWIGSRDGNEDRHREPAGSCHCPYELTIKTTHDCDEETFEEVRMLMDILVESDHVEMTNELVEEPKVEYEYMLKDKHKEDLKKFNEAEEKRIAVVKEKNVEIMKHAVALVRAGGKCSLDMVRLNDTPREPPDTWFRRSYYLDFSDISWKIHMDYNTMLAYAMSKIHDSLCCPGQTNHECDYC
jgi:hypothetical protein